nr:immunoglobulin heavy chain junction region [Mus musculus]
CARGSGYYAMDYW